MGDCKPETHKTTMSIKRFHNPIMSQYEHVLSHFTPSLSVVGWRDTHHAERYSKLNTVFDFFEMYGT